MVSRSGSLGARSARGSFWLTIGTTIQEVSRLVRNMVLVRLFAPDVFGEMAIVYAVAQLFESLTEVGVREVIIRDPAGESDEFLNAALVVSALRSVSLYVVAFFASPLIARFYGDPALSGLLRIVFIAVLFRGLISPRLYVLARNMRFRRYAIVQYGAGLSGILFTIILALAVRSTQSLAIGFAAEGALVCVLSYVLCFHSPSLRLNRSHLKSILRFARGYAGLPILTFLFLRGDIFVVGKLFEKAATGFYGMAVNLGRIPSLAISRIVVPVFTPAFSELRDDLTALRDAVVKVCFYLAVAGAPVTVAAFLYGADILSVVYTAEYAVVATPFALLFLADILRTFSIPIASVYFSIGKPEYQRMFVLVRVVLLAILIYPLTRVLGVSGAATAVLISMFLSICVQIGLLRRRIGINLARFALALAVGSLPGALVILTWFTTQRIGIGGDGIMNVAIAAGSVAICYTGWLLVLVVFPNSRIAALIRRILTTSHMGQKETNGSTSG